MVDFVVAKADNPGAAGLREQHKEFTRQRLAAAAAEVFHEEGYANARIDDIVARAGASRATFYLHFGTKADAARALIDPLIDDASNYYRKLAEIEDPSWRDIRAWLDLWLRHWDTHGPVIDAVMQASVVDPEIGKAYVDGIQRGLQILTPWLAELAEIDEETANVRISLWLMEMAWVAFHWLIRAAPFDDVTVADSLTDSLWAHIHPPSRD